MKLSNFIRLSCILCILITGNFPFKIIAEDNIDDNSPANPARNSLEALQSRFMERISRLRFTNAIWGIKVISLDTDQTVFEYNAHKLLKPASNAKLYTAALA